MDEEKLREIVRTEIDNSSVRKAVEGLEKPSVSWKDVLRHPLFLTLAAFTLTTFVGGTLERKYRNKAEIRAAETQAINALTDFVTLAYARTVEMDLLRSALKRQSSSEALQRKKDYDAAYKTWNVNFSTNMIRLRSNIAEHPENSMDVQGIYEAATIQSISAAFREGDQCLTAAFDEARRTNFGDLSEFKSNFCLNSTQDKPWHLYARDRARRVNRCAETLQELMGREIRLISAQRMAGMYDEGEENLPDTFGFTAFANGRKKRLIKESHDEWRAKVVIDLRKECPGINLK